MIPLTHRTPHVDPACVLTLSQKRALCLLSEAGLAAQAEGQDLWQFAVEIDQLLILGLSHTDLRCLLNWGYLEHAQERTRAGTNRRIFLPLQSLVLPRRTCFVLTAKGYEIASTIGSDKGIGEESHCNPLYLTDVPRWDRQARRLWWKGLLIKEFHRSAPNQELVMAAMEEEGWPEQIDDPLPQTRGVDSKHRLHDTIKCLNRYHVHRILRFCGDGRGLAIRWLLE